MLQACTISDLYRKYCSLRYVNEQAAIKAGSCSPAILGQAGANGMSRNQRDEINLEIFRAMISYTQNQMKLIEVQLEAHGISVDADIIAD